MPITDTYIPTNFKMPYSRVFACKRDEKRIRYAETQNRQATKDARKAKKQQLTDQEEAYEEIYGLLYGPGIAD